MTVNVTNPTRDRRRASASGGLSKERLRLWLRLLRTSRGIEVELRERLRVTYEITLPQFDVLAALARRDEGITLTELSRFLMVSNGNVTGIIDRLVDDGLVDRSASPGDRRATLVRLSAEGRQFFTTMAESHEAWVSELLGGLERAELATMIDKLDMLMDHLNREPAQAPAVKGGKKR